MFHFNTTVTTVSPVTREDSPRKEKTLAKREPAVILCHEVQDLLPPAEGFVTDTPIPHGVVTFDTADRIPSVWYLGNRNPLVMGKDGLHYVVLRWSGKLALVLSHPFISREKAEQTVAKIIAAGRIDTRNWDREFSINYSSVSFNKLFPWK